MLIEYWQRAKKQSCPTFETTFLVVVHYFLLLLLRLLPLAFVKVIIAVIFATEMVYLTVVTVETLELWDTR